MVNTLHLNISHPRCHMCADKALHVHTYVRTSVRLYTHSSPTMSPHLCAVGEEAPLGGEYTFLMWSADITLRQVTGQSGTHTNGVWLLGQTSPSTVLDSHTHPIHVHVRGGRSHLGQWARSPH